MSKRSPWQYAVLVVIATGCGSTQEPQLGRGAGFEESGLQGSGSQQTGSPRSGSQRSGFAQHTYRDASGNESKFIVFVPESYDAQAPCPTILFLHGSGQTGNDGQAQAQGGLGAAIRRRPQDFPFITVFPQSHQGSWRADSGDGQRALAILETVQRLYRVDRHRIYLTGYSMGGEGVWSLAGAHPDLFAAIIPICPGQNAQAAPKLKSVPVWCFQGDADAPALVQDTRSMMLAIKKAGGRPIYQEYPNVEHNCWDLAYQNGELFEWLLEHRAP
jgi:predicted peptidase